MACADTPEGTAQRFHAAVGDACGDLPMGEIAEALGYSSKSTASRKLSGESAITVEDAAKLDALLKTPNGWIEAQARSLRSGVWTPVAPPNGFAKEWTAVVPRDETRDLLIEVAPAPYDKGEPHTLSLHWAGWQCDPPPRTIPNDGFVFRVRATDMRGEGPIILTCDRYVRVRFFADDGDHPDALVPSPWKHTWTYFGVIADALTGSVVERVRVWRNRR